MIERWMRACALLCAVLAATLPLRANSLELQSIARAAADYNSPNAHLAEMFRAALLDTGKLAEYAPDGTAYIKTGDIPAEWLRDASAQARPYLFFAKDDPDTRKLLRAIIARMVKYIQIDPYANAFTLDYRVWEEKFELDSLAYPVTLSWSYWKTTGDESIFTPDFQKALDAILATMQREQDHPRDSRYTHKELPNDGKGNPVGYTGMIWTGFRPSDDACYYNFLIPSEMFAVVALGDMAEIERSVYHNVIKANEAISLRDEVQRGIQTYGLVLVPKYGYIYAYEVDGLGHAILTDDANIPSLLSAPYIGYTTPNDRYYQNTRRFLLSSDNPSFYQGEVARGIGSFHTPDHWIWPLALIMEGLTATTSSEKQDVLTQLLASDPGDHLLHESFDPDDPKRFTREDFGWPNALFSEFVLTQFQGQPEIPMGDTSDLEFRSE
ncbi:MAG TPA: glycoside hydrolase family 125 protein [Candidatus Baltobacteraceae bacterium]|nr:glycoside hydrolase family 125 protein [Candidatus Baltobacteraceae bacterium]